MSLASQCFGQFSNFARRAGQKYFDRGDVQLISRQEDELTFLVTEKTRLEREVKIGRDEEDNSLLCDCSCDTPAARWPCKHTWACLLLMDSIGVDLQAPASAGTARAKPGLVEDEDEYEYEYDDEYDDEFEPDLEAGEVLDADLMGRMPPELLDFLQNAIGLELPRKGATGDWKKLFDESYALIDEDSESAAQPWIAATSKQRLAWYVINVRETYSAGELVVDVCHQETLKSGKLGKIKPLNLSSLGERPFSDARDNRVLSRVKQLCRNHFDYDDYPSPYGSSYRSYYREPASYSVQIDPSLHDILLPEMAATGRLAWRLDDSLAVEETQTVRWEDGSPWRFRPHVKTYRKERKWVISGRLYQGDEEVSLGDPVIVLMKGVVLFPDRLARCDLASAFPWIRVLRQQSELSVSFDEKADLMERLWSLPNAEECKLPKNLQWPQHQGTPRALLRIGKPDAFLPNAPLEAEVLLRYGDQEIEATRPGKFVVDSRNKSIVKRDEQTERELSGQLEQAGAELDGLELGDDSVWIKQRELPRVVRHLVQAGWEVEASGRRIRRAGQCRMSVSSSVDWFELNAEFDFDGATVRLPELLKALRSGDQYVKLSDGSQGLLPEKWLERFGGLVDLAGEEKGAVRFRPSQAALLDALLTAQEDQTNVQVDDAFRAFSEKLKAFQGIASRDAPAGFQGQLRDYQALGLSWLHFLRDFQLGGCLADDMGLGKTIQVLALLQHCHASSGSRGESRAAGKQQVSENSEARGKSKTRRGAARKTSRHQANGKSAAPSADDGPQPPSHPSIVVAPKSLIFNWLEEAARFTPDLRILNYTGPDRKSQLEDFARYDVIITTYGTLRRDILQLKDQRFHYAVLDESQAIKNAGSQAAKACRLLVADHRLAMTGTPVENHLGELWSLFEYLNPGLLGSSTAFERMFKSSSADNPESLEVLRQALAPFILRRTKQEVLTELPEKTEQTVHCEMPAHQRRQYDELRDYYRRQLDEKIKQKGFQQAKIHVLEALLRLRQAACHPGLLDESLRHKSSAKLDTLFEQLARVRDEGHKALVFSQFTSLLSIVRERLDKHNVDYAYLDGQTRNREQRVRQFQEDPNCTAFLISLKAGGFGLNLTAAEYVFILDPWWNPAVEAQAVDRAHRIGQTRPVFAYRLICQDTVEERILELQKSKRELAEAIVSSNSNLISQLTADDLQALLS